MAAIQAEARLGVRAIAEFHRPRLRVLLRAIRTAAMLERAKVQEAYHAVLDNITVLERINVTEARQLVSPSVE